MGAWGQCCWGDETRARDYFKRNKENGVSLEKIVSHHWNS